MCECVVFRKYRCPINIQCDPECCSLGEDVVNFVVYSESLKRELKIETIYTFAVEEKTRDVLFSARWKGRKKKFGGHEKWWAGEQQRSTCTRH